MKDLAIDQMNNNYTNEQEESDREAYHQQQMDEHAQYMAEVKQFQEDFERENNVEFEEINDNDGPTW